MNDAQNDGLACVVCGSEGGEMTPTGQRGSEGSQLFRCVGCEDFGMPELMNAPVRFGLEAQGHIATIQGMLSDGRSWKEIGNSIGWHGPTAKDHYEAWSNRQRGEK